LGWLFFYILTNSGHDTSEGSVAFDLAQHWARTGEVGMDQENRYWGYLTRPGPDGRYYAAHEFGNTLAFLPFAALWNGFSQKLRPSLNPTQYEHLRRFYMSFIPPILTSLGLAIFFLLGTSVLGLTPRQSLLGTFGLGIATFYWTYAQSLNDVVLTGVLILAACSTLMKYGKTPSLRYLIMASLALGWAIITRIPAVLLIPAFVLYLVTVHYPYIGKIGRSIGVLGLVLIPFGVWQMFYNHLRSGNPFFGPVIDPVHTENNGLTGNLIDGLAGLLLSPGKSVFVYCPIALLSLWLFPGFFRRHRAEAILIMTLVFAWFLIHAKLQAWHGAAGFGPRHFVSITPILCIPWLEALRQYPQCLGLRIVTGLCLGWGALLGISATISNWFYRHMLAVEVRPSDAYLWELAVSQPVDVITSAGRNLYRLFFDTPLEVWGPASELNVYMGNTVDIWLVLACKMGLPTPVAWAIGLSLLTGAIFAWRKVWVHSTPVTITLPAPQAFEAGSTQGK
jgi:hypothetical protein